MDRASQYPLDQSDLSIRREYFPHSHPRGNKHNFQFSFENTTVYIDYRLFVESTTSELIHFRFSDAAPGIWKLVVEPIQIIDGRFHIWLPVREFLSGEVYF